MAVDYDSKSYLEKVDAWWRATTYLSGGMIFLKSNPLFSVTNTPIQKDDVKVKPIGHWGTISGQTFLYAHANRLINKYGLNMFYIGGPGHGGQVMVTNSYLDGTYTDAYPEIPRLKDVLYTSGSHSQVGLVLTWLLKLFFHEGMNLVTHFPRNWCCLRQPDQLLSRLLWWEEITAMTGGTPSFLNPMNDGAVLPIFDLTGQDFNPTIFGRAMTRSLSSLKVWVGHLVSWETMIFMITHLPRKSVVIYQAIVRSSKSKKTLVKRQVRRWDYPSLASCYCALTKGLGRS